MYQPRFYQQGFNRERFRFFTVRWKETELMVGTDQSSAKADMERFCVDEIVALRQVLDEHISKEPLFLTSHQPLECPEDSHPEISAMCWAGQKAGTGPMAAVAGIFAKYIGEGLSRTFHVHELFVENGGDIYLMTEDRLLFSVYAGASPLSGKFGIEIPPGICGICTSSGKLGHSFSYGKADAVTIACDSAPLADAYATAFANKISKPGDIIPVIGELNSLTDIRSAVLICDDKVGFRGEFRVLPVRNG